MSNFEDKDGEDITRRNFFCGAVAAIAGIAVLRATVAGQQPKQSVAKAFDDPNITHGWINFKSGTDTIDGFLARPKAKGRYPVVLVIPGNKVTEEYIPNTTAMLAQAGFVGLAVNIFSLIPAGATPAEGAKILDTQITDERIFRDVQAGIDYLKPQPFVKRGRIGITGFCFGGRIALMFAAKSKDIKAVVPFYGTLVLPPEANRPTTPFDVVKQIRAPVQGHYAKTDRNIELADVKKLEEALRAQGTPAEMFTYDASHGFFAYTRPAYNPEVAKLAWSRALGFLKRHLK